MQTRTEIEEWKVDICDDCGHDVAYHYNTPEEIKDNNGKYLYTAIGCMVITGERQLPGDNPYKRCKCLLSK